MPVRTAFSVLLALIMWMGAPFCAYSAQARGERIPANLNEEEHEHDDRGDERAVIARRAMPPPPRPGRAVLAPLARPVVVAIGASSAPVVPALHPSQFSVRLLI